MHATRDYEALFPTLMEALFESSDGKIEAEKILSQYEHNEQDRIKVGILKVSNGDFEKMRTLVDLANLDWRDLLVEAEFSLSFSNNRLRRSDPDAYRKLQDREIQEYDEWIRATMAS